MLQTSNVFVLFLCFFVFLRSASFRDRVGVWFVRTSSKVNTVLFHFAVLLAFFVEVTLAPTACESNFVQ